MKLGSGRDIVIFPKLCSFTLAFAFLALQVHAVPKDFEDRLLATVGSTSPPFLIDSFGLS